MGVFEMLLSNPSRVRLATSSLCGHRELISRGLIRLYSVDDPMASLKRPVISKITKITKPFKTINE